MALCVPALAAEKVGVAVDITVQVSGQGGAFARGDAIHRDESIRTNASGVGAFQFVDGTKLAVGPNSTVVIDKYVFAGGDTVKKLTLGATKGTLRWISGKSDHSAYKITTPSGTLGVRGTAFDVYVGANGVTAVTLLSGSAQFCGGSGCQTLQRHCDFIVAKPGGAVTKPRGIVRDIGLPVSGSQAFPFLSGRAGLPRGFRTASSCEGLSAMPTNDTGFGNRPLQHVPDIPDKPRNG